MLDTIFSDIDRIISNHSGAAEINARALLTGSVPSVESDFYLLATSDCSTLGYA
jgi:hypothetical protein